MGIQTSRLKDSQIFRGKSSESGPYVVVQFEFHLLVSRFKKFKLNQYRAVLCRWYFRITAARRRERIHRGRRDSIGRERSHREQDPPNHTAVRRPRAKWRIQKSG